MPVRLSTATAAFLNGCGGPLRDVSRRALNRMEDILSAYYKCILSAITHKLNVSGHMLVSKSRAQSLSVPFSYILCMCVCMCVCVCIYIYIYIYSVVVKALCYKPEGCGFQTR
jgi:hypothetical protein